MCPGAVEKKIMSSFQKPSDVTHGESLCSMNMMGSFC